MRATSVRSSGAVLIALLLVGSSMVEARPPQRRPSRRATNPVRPRPAPTPAPDASEPALVSTADEEAEGTPRPAPRGQTRRAAGPVAQPEPDPLRGTVERLSTAVERLSNDVTSMKSDQRALFELERLTRAEQRAEGLRAQLRDVTDKELNYQERLLQIEDELQPDSIQRRAAVMGTLNPGSVRDAIRSSLERERESVRRRLELVTNSRTRLEAAVSSAELETERLRQRVEAADQPQANTGATPETAAPAPTATPTPTPAEPPHD